MDSHPGWLERKMAEHYRRVELRKDEREEELRRSWEYRGRAPPDPQAARSDREAPGDGLPGLMS